MTQIELAQMAARGIAETGIEGWYGSVASSTAGDWPSLGISQWEGIRADALLRSIPGGDAYRGLSYTDLTRSGKFHALSALLDSDAGRRAQIARLAADCEEYIAALCQIQPLGRPRCMIYAAMWCPTSLYTVVTFLKNREHRINLSDLETLHRLFQEDYAHAAGVAIYAPGYRNRADKTYDYVVKIRN